MAMTRENMEDEVRANIKRSASGLATSRIDTWLDWGQNLISDWHTYEEMRLTTTTTTTASVKNYLFPTRMKDIATLTLQDGASSRKLIYVHYRNFDKDVPRPEQTTTGRSKYYVDYGQSFDLYRLPDASYTLNWRYSQYPADLVASGTSQLNRKDALICASATMFGFLSLREIEDATYWKEQVVKPLYIASLESDHSAEDWVPIARGFDTTEDRLGVYWTNPLVKSMP